MLPYLNAGNKSKEISGNIIFAFPMLDMLPYLNAGNKSGETLC